MRIAFDLLLRFFGYARVPAEAAQLACATRLKWEANPADPNVGEGLRALERFVRSAQ